ncbi:MAG: hypothetical protein KTR21_13645 [Rhodobacteraceae bacterium]|nr:hypothetical protein [Paracoccaceae bacterium]
MKAFQRGFAALALAWVVAGCAATLQEDVESSQQDLAGALQSALSKLRVDRDEFDPARCRGGAPEAFAAVIDGQRYEAPLSLFLSARADPRRAPSVSDSAGCPEAPLQAAALTVALSEDLQEASATILAIGVEEALRRRTALVRRLTAVLDDQTVCRPQRMPGLWRCGIALSSDPDEKRQAAQPQLRNSYVLVLARADAPSLAGTLFAARCIVTPEERRCDIMDSLHDGAVLLIDFDPDRISPARLIELHGAAVNLAQYLRKNPDI